MDVTTFETLFRDVEENPTYEALSGSHTFKLGDTQYTMTAGEMGYKSISTNGKSEGCLNLNQQTGALTQLGIRQYGNLFTIG